MAALQLQRNQPLEGTRPPWRSRSPPHRADRRSTIPRASRRSIKRCTYRRHVARPRAGADLRGGVPVPGPQGAGAARRPRLREPICNACTAAHIFRPDEDCRWCSRPVASEAPARRPVSRVLYRGSRRGDGHPSGAAGGPTARAADPRGWAARLSPADRGCALLFGLAPGGVCRVSPVSGPRPARGIVTVALVLASRRTGVTRHPCAGELGLSSRTIRSPARRDHAAHLAGPRSVVRPEPPSSRDGPRRRPPVGPGPSVPCTCGPRPVTVDERGRVETDAPDLRHVAVGAAAPAPSRRLAEASELGAVVTLAEARRRDQSTPGGQRRRDQCRRSGDLGASPPPTWISWTAARRWS